MFWLIAADGDIDLTSPWAIVAMTLPFVVMLIGRITGRSMKKRKSGDFERPG
jgi:hypothetical protein